MRKRFFCTKLLNIFVIAVLLMTACPPFAISAKANNDPYEEAFNIHDAITYAVANSERELSKNEISIADGGNCTYFVSKCAVAGGLPMDNKWNDDDTKIFFNIFISKPSYTTFVNVDRLRKYLSDKNYIVESFEYNFDGNLPSLPSPGDIVQFDFELDGEGDHSMFCIGYDENGKLCLAQNSPNEIWTFENTMSELEDHGRIKIYYIRMTNTSGLVDVTNRYIGKYIAIKSLEVNRYVSSNTDQNITTVDAMANRSDASTWEYFKVESGDYGEVGFRSVANGNYLSSRIDINSKFAPIRAAYGQTYEKPQSWESFRIYEKDGVQYIQSQANGKWIQVVADNADYPIKAAGKRVSTWERFQIEIVDYSPNNAVSESPSEDVITNIPNNVPNSTIVSQYYWKTNYINGWYEGEWKNNHPNGWGKLTYDESNQYRYTLGNNNKALYYEGEFLDGLRYGYGTVVYENGYKDEGIFYGSWQKGKKVFEGKRWLINDTYNGYWSIIITATSTRDSNIEYGSWQSVK